MQLFAKLHFTARYTAAKMNELGFQTRLLKLHHISNRNTPIYR